MKKYLVMLLVSAILLVSGLMTVLPGVAMAASYTSDLIPVMTSDTTPSGIASASSMYSASYDAYKAFTQEDLNDCWATADNTVTGWLAYQFPAPEIISKYTFMCQNYAPNGPSSAPKDWTFEGSNDGTTWVVLDTETGITGWTLGQEKDFAFNNTAAYTEYRINITANNGCWYTAVNDMQMMSQTLSPPTNLSATAGNASVDLTWTPVTGATSYNVKRATTSGGPYTTIASSVTSATYTDTSVTNGTTYFYVVTSLSGSVESGNSSEVSATPQASSGQAALWVTMENGSDLEYNLSMAQINAFISWYNSKATGVGQPYYCLSATPVAPYTSRTDYIIFDKIVDFKVEQ